MPNDDEDIESYPVTYSIDNAILMHRDSHFSGSFPFMLEYYKKQGKGALKDFEVSRIEELFEMEQKAGKNLAPLLLSGAEAEEVARAKQSYKTLRGIYEISRPQSKLPMLISDLILSEEEDEGSAIQAIAAEKSAIVPLLIELLQTQDLYNPLFPGYGKAPLLAAKCLGLIGDKRAIIALFEMIGEEDLFNEDIILEALHSIGTPAKEFLLKVLHGRPYTFDNEHAAIALASFKEDPEVSSVCLKMLHEIDLNKHLFLATYLILACENLTSFSQQQELLDLANHPSTPRAIQQDILALAKGWNKSKIN